MEIKNNISITYLPPEATTEVDPRLSHKVTGILRCAKEECDLVRGAQVSEFGNSVEAATRRVLSRSQVYVNTFCLERGCTLIPQPKPDSQLLERTNESYAQLMQDPQARG
jgi:hypothetical protein